VLRFENRMHFRQPLDLKIELYICKHQVNTERECDCSVTTNLAILNTQASEKDDCARHYLYYTFINQVAIALHYILSFILVHVQLFINVKPPRFYRNYYIDWHIYIHISGYVSKMDIIVVEYYGLFELYGY